MPQALACRRRFETVVKREIDASSEKERAMTQLDHLSRLAALIRCQLYCNP